MAHHWAAVVLLIAAGCGRQGHWEDSLDAPADVPPLPDAPVATEAVVEHVLDGAALAASVGWAFGDELHAMHRLASPTESDARDVVLHGLAAGHLFAPSGCVSTEWTASTRARLTLTDCRLALTDEPVAGAVSLEVALAPAALRLTAIDLSVSGLVMNGTIELQPVRSLDVNLVYVEEGRVVSVSSTSATVGMGLEGEVGLFLTGSWARDRDSGRLLLDLFWHPGECLPFQLGVTSGGAPFQEAMRIHIDEETPSSGLVHAGWMPITLGSCD